MAPSSAPTTFSIIDSHVHLWPASEQETLAWMTPDLPIHGQHSLDDYVAAVTVPVPSLKPSSASDSTSDSSEQTQQDPQSPPKSLMLKGFVYLETDRRTDHSDLSDPESWTHPLREIAYLSRICNASPALPDEGHSPLQSHLCLAFIPWAPVPAGPSALSSYFTLAEQAAGSAFSRLKGVRYLVQDKPAGTMLKDEVVEGVKWLGKRGLRFDLGVDIHRRGVEHLRECVEMVGRVYDGVEEGQRAVMVVDHCAKPDLTVVHSLSGDVESHAPFTAWRASMRQLSSFPKVYIKLSGFFTELDPDFVLNGSVEDIVTVLKPWVKVLFDTFGPSRILFGSDWPVCEFGMAGGGKERQGLAWGKWVLVVEGLLDVLAVGEQDRRQVWEGSARRAYGLDLD